MEIIDLELNQIPKGKDNLILCLGYFDAMHLGHVNLIKEALKENEPVAVMTFDLPPLVALKKREMNCSITSLYDKAKILESLGIDILYILPFNEELMNYSKDDFIDKVLKPLNPLKIFIGEDYHFGKNAEGNSEYLKQHFDVNIVKLLKVNNEKLSSSRIIEMIREGNLTHVNKALGRYYRITGLVVEGNKVGRTLGFPTANLELGYPYVFPKEGVYVGQVDIYGDLHFAIISVSRHPTILELMQPIIEVNIDDYEGNLYGKEISVDFIEYISEIIKFDSLDDLKKRLEYYRSYLYSKYKL